VRRVCRDATRMHNAATSAGRTGDEKCLRCATSVVGLRRGVLAAATSAGRTATRSASRRRRVLVGLRRGVKYAARTDGTDASVIRKMVIVIYRRAFCKPPPDQLERELGPVDTTAAFPCAWAPSLLERVYATLDGSVVERIASEGQSVSKKLVCRVTTHAPRRHAWSAESKIMRDTVTGTETRSRLFVSSLPLRGGERSSWSAST